MLTCFMPLLLPASLTVMAVLILAPVRALAEQGPLPEHTVALRAGDLTCVLGDHYDHGAGKTGYIGIHSLTHRDQTESPFFPRYAGLIIARDTARVSKVSESEGQIQHFSQGAPACLMRFRLVPPHYADVEIESTRPAQTFSLNSASYMNGPEDPGIYFVDPSGKWQRHHDPEHGNAASVFPQGAPLPKLAPVPNALYRHGTNAFSDSVSEWRYDPQLAFYYGRFRNMVLIQMFPPDCGVVPYMSPSGGGMHPSGRKNPAWDWRGQFLNPRPEQKAVLRMRVVYKPFVSDEDVLSEYRNWCALLPRAPQG